MTRKLFTVAVLTALSASALLASGCASGSGKSDQAPYSLTGTNADATSYSDRVAQNRAAARGDYSWKYRNAADGTNGR